MSNNDIYVQENTLSDSIIFKSFNNNAEVNSHIISAMKNSIEITKDYIEEQLLQIKKTNLSPLAEDVVKAYEDGDILILYSKKVRTPKFIPYIITKIKGQIKAIIFINNFATISKNKTDSSQKYLNISMKDLYALMEGAYIGINHTMFPNRINKSLTLMRICSNIYANLFIRIFNKECQLSMDLQSLQNVTFCLSKFFLEKVWEYKNEDVIFTYAKGNIMGTVNSSQLLIISNQYDSKKITNLKELLDFIEEICPKINMSFRYLVQCYINSYKDVSLLSMDTLSYFLFVVEATMIGSFIVNQALISDVTKDTKNMNQFYPELVKSVV